MQSLKIINSFYFVELVVYVYILEASKKSSTKMFGPATIIKFKNSQ